MLFLKYLFLIVGFGLFGTSCGLVLYDVYLSFELERLLRRGGSEAAPAQRRPRRPIRWRHAAQIAGVGFFAFLLAQSIVVVPDGEAGVRVSQISGVVPGTLYPGTHLIIPLVERVALFDIRDHVYMTAAVPNSKEKLELLTVEGREGLSIGLAVVVRYRVDPRRLDYVQANLPLPVDDEIVAPTVASVFRETAPNYVVRELFATKREEFRARVAGELVKRLSDDGIVVKEVMLRRIELPEDYARGLEDILVKEQESERMEFDTQIEQKRVQIAGFQADAAKVREVKQAEGDAQSRVIAAKAESDSMQYTLPLKQKQIEQTRLEAEARKQSTITNAQAMAEAKVIDSKAEQQRQELLAQSEADRIRLTSAAEAEQLRLEAAALKGNPLLIQKIVAERLSDKIQIMMVPMDGKFFFSNDVLRAIPSTVTEDDPPEKGAARP
ncbi:MAG: SPFH domain-containing protein [Candidatus Acidiferrales bacterium]